MTRLIWCTGAGKGIGRAAALELAKRGNHVVASSRTGEDLESLAAESSGMAGRITPCIVDVTDAAAVSAAVDAIEAEHGPIAIALLNAGTHQPLSVSDFRIETFRRLMETNFFGAVNGLAALLPRFTGRRAGHVAIVASVAGYRGLPSAAAYGASKAAVIVMCEALKPELDRYGVKLTLINPGFIKTPLTDRNDFQMPFLRSAEFAAVRIADGLDRGSFEITFPRRFTWGLKVLRCLPYPLFFALTRSLLRDR